MNKLKFGIDIDGTVTTPDAIVPFLNKDFGLSITLDDIKDYDLSLLVECSKEEFAKWWGKNEALVYKHSPLVKDARETLLHWAKKHELYFISARSKHLVKETEAWFRQYSIPFHHIELIGSHDKVETIKERKLELFFEDKVDNAIAIHEQCQIPVVLFDTPYNQHPIPDGVIRVTNWMEARSWVEDWVEKNNA